MLKITMRVAGILGVMFALCLTAFAQSTTQNSTKSYKLKPEDILHIQVFNQQQITADVPVSEDGTITAPFVGVISVEGKTVTEVEKDLFELYKKKLLLRDPIVSVTIVQFRRLKANINGMVLRPGEVIFRPGDTILHLLSSGGSYIPDTADPRKATLRHKNSKELIPIDLFALTVSGDNSQNYELQDGDVLDVPQEQRNRIMVLGEVINPGLFPYRESMHLNEAIAISGGVKPYRARASKCYIIRELPGRPGEYMQINADFVKFQSGRGSEQNVKLMPGDMVIVPATNTPDFQQISSLVNSIFVLNSLGNLFGFKIGG